MVGPLGTFLAQPVWDKELIVYADLHRDDLIESRVSALVRACTLEPANRCRVHRWTLILLAAIPDQISCRCCLGFKLEKKLTLFQVN